MATSNNPMMHGVRGSIGKQLVYRQFKGKTIVCAYPDMSGRRLSNAQKRQNDNLRIANAEVRRIKLDESLRNEAQLRLNVSREQLHHALLKEELLKLSSKKS
jgi:hypothetical protein